MKRYPKAIAFALIVGGGAIAIGVCAFHSSTAIRRYLQYEVHQAISTTRNLSLPIPVVSFTLKSSRNKTNANDTFMLPQLKSFSLKLNDSNLLDEMYVVENETYLHSLVVTVKFRSGDPELLF